VQRLRSCREDQGAARLIFLAKNKNLWMVELRINALLLSVERSGLNNHFSHDGNDELHYPYERGKIGK
jgi:hypothetical protein